MAESVPQSIVVSLANERIWQTFNEVGTEMVVTKTGRNLYPKLQYKVAGLDPDRKYVMYLRFELVDNKKYKYKNGGWAATECCDPLEEATYVMHPDGSKNGDHWLKNGVSFDRVKITNNADDPRDNVLLQSMRKYCPTISVYLADENVPFSNEMLKLADFSTPLQDFIAVTAYQNSRVTELKIRNNPYAKGFREGPKNRKRSLSSVGTTPSPELKISPVMRNEYGAPSYYPNQYQQSPTQFAFQQPMYQQFYPQYPPGNQVYPQMQQGTSSSSQFYPQVPNYYYQNPWAVQSPNGQYMFNSYPNNPEGPNDSNA